MRKSLLNSGIALGLALMGIRGSANAQQTNAQWSRLAMQAINQNHLSDAGRYFINDYKSNTSANQSAQTNAAIDLLSQMDRVWQPGSAWNNGKALNQSVLDYNMKQSQRIAWQRTTSEANDACLDDRNDTGFSVQEGLGNLTDYYRLTANVSGGLTAVPSDATTTNYTRPKGGKVIGTTDSKLGKMVTLTNTMRGDYASTIAAKKFYKYPQPFRWVDGIGANNDQTNGVILPMLSIDAKNNSPVDDYGYPSGHTNSAYLAAYSMAYAYPERFQSLLFRASEVGNNRIVAGRHSLLDVMGGRALSTAMVAAVLNDPANQELKQQAYQQAQTVFQGAKGNGNYYGTGDDASNDAEFNYRMTYGFKRLATAKNQFKVPKGAEVLLETRLPYLSAEQRRVVLATTELPAGYPILDDGEGLGRLNLYRAADGYGQLVSDTTVDMYAGLGGFNAKDTWKNNISGIGGLTKNGTGTLVLSCNNYFSGGVLVNGGTLVAANPNALGTGNVAVKNDRLQLDSKRVTIAGQYHQSTGGTIVIKKASQLVVKQGATLGGTLKLNGETFRNGDRIMRYGSRTGCFARVTGLPKFTTSMILALPVNNGGALAIKLMASNSALLKYGSLLRVN